MFTQTFFLLGTYLSFFEALFLLLCDISSLDIYDLGYLLEHESKVGREFLFQLEIRIGSDISCHSLGGDAVISRQLIVKFLDYLRGHGLQLP